MKSTVLLASDDSALIVAVGEAMSPIDGLRLEVVPTGGTACDQVIREDVLLVIVHLEEGGSVAEITRLLQTIALTSPSVTTLVVSDRHHAEQALALLRLGVADYLTRPLDLGRLTYLIDVLTLRARHFGRPPCRADPFPGEPVQLLEDDRSFIYLPLTKMGRVMDQIKRIAPQDATILLGGETGTGKSRLAHLIHRISPRRGRPFLAINCGALSSQLVESEMFGHVKGAFTGADTDRVGKFSEVGRGTLFLDEVDSLPLPLQAKLLRAVEERVFEPVGSNKTQPMQARLIAASNRPLDREVAEGRFRVDLFYRLNVVAFTVPPLRDRREIVPHLVRGFIDEFAIRSGQPVHEIGPDALLALEAHDWPGNIRELRNVIERAVLLCPGHVIHADDLPEHLQGLAREVPPTAAPVAPSATPSSLSDSKEVAERARIAEALGKHKNNRLRAAAELGISRMTLYNKLRKYGLMIAN